MSNKASAMPKNPAPSDAEGSGEEPSKGGRPAKRLRNPPPTNASAGTATEATPAETETAGAASPSPEVSQVVKRIRDMLQRVGDRKQDWLHLVDDQLPDDNQSAEKLRKLLADYARAPGRKPWSVAVSRMTARRDLQRAQFTDASDVERFNVGKWIDDPHNDDAITIKKTKTYLRPGGGRQTSLDSLF